MSGKTLPGAPQPLTEQERRGKALYETLMVCADVALEAGEDRIAELLQSMAGQGTTIHRLQHFNMAARKRSVIPSRDAVRGEYYVPLDDVFDLLKNFALGAPPEGLIADAKVPRPSWYGKDINGYLLSRGWKPLDGYAGMYRGDVYIAAADIAASTEADAAAVLELEAMARPRPRTDLPGSYPRSVVGGPLS